MIDYGEVRLLVVGAGGIGCELLKTLVVTGFKDIEIIDLDTIEVSNLNRQFLFNKSHVGLSKAKVARESILRMNPNATVIAHHKDVSSPQFDREFFKSFHIVLNALDNRAARSHVNKMCILANVPMIDGGTAGFLGQLHVIKKSVTACYECEPKSDNKRKNYPICTIRNTPSEMIHCVVWGKYLFELLFSSTTTVGNSSHKIFQKNSINDQNDIEDDEALLSSKLDQLKKDGVTSIDTFIGFLLKKYFKDDICKLLSMHELWHNRKKPTLLDDTLFDISNDPSKSVYILDNFITVSLNEYVSIFVNSAKKLIECWLNSDYYIKWDKDLDLIVDFTAAAANIRATIFGIPNETKFEIKSMAGNIIPAIATTNAIIAGLMVAEAIKIAEGNINKCHSVYISKHVTPSSKLFIPCKPDPPNPNCLICAEKSFLIINTDLDVVSVNQLQIFLKKHCHIETLEVVDQRTGKIIISSDTDDMPHSTQIKCLSSLGLVNGSILNVDDFDNDISYEVIIKQRPIHESSGNNIEIIEQHRVSNTKKLISRKRSSSVSGINQVTLCTKKISKLEPSSHSDDLILEETSSNSDIEIVEIKQN